MLLENEKFCRIYLDKNQIKDEGIESVCELIYSNYNLIHLDLSSNDISPEGLCLIFSVLQKNTNIISLAVGSKDCFNRNRMNEKSSLALQ
jgi:Ran GTPase-activating protein (RanGAP) involved in mRNA processing and transport